MNEAEAQSIFLGVLGGLIPMAAAIVAVVNWINSRFDVLKSRQQEGDAKQAIEIEKLRAKIESCRASGINDREMAEYRINGNTELIQHRTERFCKELEALEKRLSTELEEVKGYLARTSDFRIRGQE